MPFPRFPVLWAALLAGVLAACDLPAGQQTTQSAPTSQTATRSTSTPSTPPSTPARTQNSRDPASGLRWIARGELPTQGQTLLNTIAQGGPFRYSKDGATFGNREGILPEHNRGYYREYTVTTPGESDRGARRIVCGGQSARSTAECYYTADHYASFRRIRK